MLRWSDAGKRQHRMRRTSARSIEPDPRGAAAAPGPPKRRASRLESNFLQPANETGGYRPVVAHPRHEGNAW
jgi:hypothetical protein